MLRAAVPSLFDAGAVVGRAVEARTAAEWLGAAAAELGRGGELQPQLPAVACVTKAACKPAVLRVNTPSQAQMQEAMQGKLAASLAAELFRNTELL